MHLNSKSLLLLEKLNLYNVDGGIGKTLQGIKKLVVDGDPNNTSQCNDVLIKFFTACDPNSESCSNANQHTFQGKHCTSILSAHFNVICILPVFTFNSKLPLIKCAKQ